MRPDKVLSLVSLACKAGACVSGGFLTEQEVRADRAKLVMVAVDASENTKKRFRDQCRFRGVPFLLYGKKEELGHAMGKEFRACLAVKSQGLAEGILTQLGMRQPREGNRR